VTMRQLLDEAAGDGACNVNNMEQIQAIMEAARTTGPMKQRRRVPVTEIQRGIRHGVRTINVDSDSRLATTGATCTHLVEHPDDFDPRWYLKPARTAMQAVTERLPAFGQAGHAGDATPSLVDATRRRCGAAS
jgi:fructose-bisphosphate aldolase, class II